MDGRSKPDCVAPGEQILSCRHNPRRAAERVHELYYKLDGTSMAAPHVVGAAALLLQRHPIWSAYQVKSALMLCRTATDLGRERRFQGAGMVDVLRALQSI